MYCFRYKAEQEKSYCLSSCSYLLGLDLASGLNRLFLIRDFVKGSSKSDVLEADVSE